MRQRWIDARLNFTAYDEDITLNYNMFDRLWVPDLFVKNEKKGTFHKITVPNRLLKISPNGQIYYSQRLVYSFCLSKLFMRGLNFKRRSPTGISDSDLGWFAWKLSPKIIETPFVVTKLKFYKRCWHKVAWHKVLSTSIGRQCLFISGRIARILM